MAGVARSYGALVPLALACVLSACAASGVNHVVRPGENLYRIGKAYGISYKDLARVNGIRPPYRIRVGQTVYVPGADRQLPVTLITPRSVSAAPPAGAPRRTPARLTDVDVRRDGRAGAAGFSWPLSGRLSSGFGKRTRGHHDGIDIVAPRGAAVYTARDGRVIFSDRLSGYGNVVIVEHAGGFTTVYAHNERNLVRKGALVRRGERIAIVGDTGRASGPHLHFEIRKDNVARNPLYYLPASGTRSVAAVP